jgi:hypothetical protein
MHDFLNTVQSNAPESPFQAENRADVIAAPTILSGGWPTCPFLSALAGLADV